MTPDAGTPDAGTPDAGTPDAGTADGPGWICVTCGVEQPAAPSGGAPVRCPICEDERQYVGWKG